jgi:hypothetical protein
MGLFKNFFKPGKFRTIQTVNDLPTVQITLFRIDEHDDKIFEDVITMRTAYPPRVGDSVQGYDFDFHEVAVVNVSYLDSSPPVYQVTCKVPKRS